MSFCPRIQSVKRTISEGVRKVSMQDLFDKNLFPIKIPLSLGFQIILLAKTTYLHLHSFLYFGPEKPKCKLGEHQLHSELQEQWRDEAPKEEVHHRDREEGTKQLLDVGQEVRSSSSKSG